LSVAYGNLVGLLIEAVKELKAEVQDLKAEVQDLKSKNN
jgi:cell division protein FtsB